MALLNCLKLKLTVDVHCVLQSVELYLSLSLFIYSAIFVSVSGFIYSLTPVLSPAISSSSPDHPVVSNHFIRTSCFLEQEAYLYPADSVTSNYKQKAVCPICKYFSNLIIKYYYSHCC